MKSLRNGLLSLVLGVIFGIGLQFGAEQYSATTADKSPAYSITVVDQASAASLSNYSENKIVDWFLRGQTYTPPATQYFALATTAGSDAACGTEVATGSYARVSVTSSLTNFAGTQSAGSTAVSGGTGGTISNNIVLTFPAPTANWGSIVEFCVFDASTSGNLLYRAALGTAKTVNNGDAAPSFAIGAATFQIDN